MLKEFKLHLENTFPYLANKKLLLAVSGGVDSMVMLDLLHSLNYAVEVAHCNFQLRGKDAIEDKLLVEQTCNKLSIPFHSINFETQKIATQEKKSIQLIARELRYNWFYELLSTKNLDYVLTAHHLNDALETFVFNLSRGSGLKGLSGILELNNKTARPLLVFSKYDILAYANKQKVSWREDASNEKTIYGRNFIRHKIIPELENLNSEFLNNFKNSQLILRENNQIIEHYFSNLKAKLIISKADLQVILIEEILKETPINSVLFNIFSEFGFYAIEEIKKLLKSETGSKIESKTHVLLKNRTEILIKAKKEAKSNEKHLIHLENSNFLIENPIKLKFKISNSTLNDFDLSLDLDKIKLPLQLRKWQDGDFFFPSGMNGKKKVSKFFKDQKLSIFEKEESWLLCDAEDSVIWLVNYRTDNRFKIESKTTNILNIKIC